jgi:hypothetical protein
MITFFIAITLCQNPAAQTFELQAAKKLGAKVAAVQKKLPVVNQVVLVPDEATYLDEISRWSPTQRWPVLFNQEPKVSQFIRRFSPEKVWIRDSVGKVGDVGSAMQQTVAAAWGGEGTVKQALDEIKLPPLGVVITSTTDSARTAAVALAAGRGQLLTFMPSNWDEENKVLIESKTTSLVREVHKTLSNTGLTFDVIGDEVDALTVCMSLPARVDYSAATKNPVAVSDVIGRNEMGERFAWTGWIFGSKANAAYMAMCSLFLDRTRYWFCNTYPDKGGWEKYGTGNILKILPNFGIHATKTNGTLQSLQEAEVGGVRADVIYFTSKGNQDFFDMADERTSPTWIPLLDMPSALYFLHSWSLKNPSGRMTVGGTWLSRGVYAYVGSSHEPMLQAFVPQTEIMRRTMSLVPFLLASRWSAGDFVYSKPWRLNTIGDPLMLCPPKNSVTRIINPAVQLPDYQDIAALAKNAMQTVNDNPSDESFATAIHTIALLGQDSMIAKLWNLATNMGVAGAETSRAAMPALFRQQNTDNFIWAFLKTKNPTRLEQDMLWQLAGISPTTSIQLLIDNLRSPYQVDDLKVIADRLVSKRGPNAILDIIDNLLPNAKGRNERELKRMRKKYDK